MSSLTCMYLMFFDIFIKMYVCMYVLYAQSQTKGPQLDNSFTSNIHLHCYRHLRNYIHTYVNTYIHTYSAPIIPYLCVFVGIWCTLFLEFWKRKEKMTAMKWGMIGFEEEEQDRFCYATVCMCVCMYACLCVCMYVCG